MSNRLKIVYFGSSGDLSFRPFEALLQSSHEILAVVVNECPSIEQGIDLIPIDQQDSIQSVAFKNKIQILKFNHKITELGSAIESLKPDVIVTSCFAHKIPSSILTIPKLASLNLHPSLLPKYRGPDPLFWQIRNAVIETGVTIHLMNNQFDAGDIVAQHSVNVKPSMNISDLEKKLAIESSRLLIQAFQNIHNKIVLAKPQDTKISSYYSYPKVSDFKIPETWNARRVYHFMKATESIASYFPLMIDGEEMRLVQAIDFNAQGTIDLTLEGNQITFPCRAGYVKAEFLTL